MITRKYIRTKERAHLADLLKTYESIVETTAEYPLVKETFKGARHAISNIVDILDFTLNHYLFLDYLILLGDIYLDNYRHVTQLSSRTYWKGAYDEILKMIEKYFYIKLRSDI